MCRFLALGSTFLAVFLAGALAYAQAPAEVAGGRHYGLRQILDRVEQDPAFAGEQVTVILESSGVPLDPSWVAARGGVSRYRHGRAHEISIPAGRLPQFLKELPADVSARRPYPHHPDAIESQGVALTGAGDFHTLGMQGSGGAIGVIDLEFGSLAASQAAGELPLSLVTDYTGTGTGGGTHGTNVAEIVHDMAPGATLYLAKIASDVQMAQAVDDMIALGVKVIVHSASWFTAAFYDGTGPLCAIANTAESAGVQWVNAAGNYRHNHYLGTFSDSNGDLRHEFAAGVNYNTISLSSGNTIYLYLNWKAYPATKTDYDLFLFNGDPNSGGVVVASSVNKPGPGQFGAIPPVEEITYTPAASGTYYVVVVKASTVTANLPLTLFSVGAPLGTQTTASSLSQPSDCPNVIAVAAANLSDQVEDFSSEGPGLTPTTSVRNKPEVTGPDWVQTSLTSSFGGTSAAAPHVGGAAALLMAQFPGLPPAQIRPMLFAAVKDINTPGFDFRTGNGRTSLDADGDGVNHDADNCRLTANLNQMDTDGDGIGDACDNCTLVANADQRDTNGDRYGNMCDGDLNNDGATNTLDLNLYKTVHRSQLGDPNYNPDADFNGDGSINTLDLNIYKLLHRKAPGPSGLAP